MKITQKNEEKIISFLQRLDGEKQLNFRQIFQRRLISSNRTVTSQTLKALFEEGLIKREPWRQGQSLLHTITPKGKQWLIKKKSEDVVRCLQELKDLTLSIDPEKAMRQEAKEQNIVWDQLENDGFKGKTGSEVIELFKQNEAATRKHWPLHEILTNLHELYVAIEKGVMDSNSFYTVIKGNRSWIVRAKLLKESFLDLRAAAS